MIEPRILFSATAVDAVVDESDTPSTEVVLEKTVWQAEEPAAAGEALDAEAALLAELNRLSADLESRGGTEFIFISAGLYDEAYLSEHLSPAFEVHRIDAGSDAISQIAEVLEGRTGIDAIHLIGHGESGRLFLGDTVLDSDSMAGGHGELLQRIGLSLSDDADILVYGCDFAEGAVGQAAASTLAELTGAEVAASSDDTGAASLGGDWELEYANGAIEASAISLPGFNGLLAPPVWSISGSANVNEGSSATYTIALTGSASGATSVDLSLIEGSTTSGDHASFIAAVDAAVASRSDLSFDGTTLTYTPTGAYTSTHYTSGSSYSNISGLSGVTSHDLSDDSSSSASIGFSFEFYGTTYSSLHVGSNGFVTFGAGSSDFTNEDFSGGNTIDGRPAIAPLWDDWDPGATSGIEVRSITTGTAGNRQFIVQWSNIVHFAGSKTASFQMVLNESDGSIEFRYDDVDIESTWDFGKSATIGISDGASNYEQFSFETASIANNQRIVYSRSGSMSPLTITLGTVNDTTPEPSENFQISLSNASNSTLGTSSVTTTILDNDPGAPVGIDDGFSANEDSASAIVGNALSNDTDPNGDSLSATPASGAGSAGGLFTVAANGQVTFDPNGQFEDLMNGEIRVTTFNYTVDDGSGGSDVAQISVTVHGANDAPVVVVTVPVQSGSDGETIAPLDLSVYFDDVDVSDTFTYSAGGLPPGLSIDIHTGVITGTISASASSVPSYSVSVTAHDSAGAFVSQSFFWNISNPTPVANDDNFSASENDGAIVVGNVITASDHDPDGDSISVLPLTAVAGDNGGLFWVAANGTVTFDPNGDFETLGLGDSVATSIAYTLVDSDGGAAIATVTVTVTGENDGPLTTPSAIVVDEESADTPLGIAAPTDIDGDALSVTVTGLPSVGQVTLADGTPVSDGMLLTVAQLTGLQYDAPADLAATTVTGFDYTVSDGTASAVTGSTGITVNPINDAPGLTGDIFSVDEDHMVSIDVLANDSDVDGGALTITHVGGQIISDGGAAVTVTNGTVVLSGGVLIFTPDPDYHGAIVFSYTVSDGIDSSTALVNGMVNEVTEAVSINHVSTAENGTLTFAATLGGNVPGGFTVDVSTVSGMALSGVDFVALSTTLTFSGTAGEVVTFAVTPIEDDLIENDETFTLVLSNVSNPGVSISGTATGTIIDNDARLTPTVPGEGVTTDIELVSNGSGGFDLVIEDVETDSPIGFASDVPVSDSGDNLIIYRDGSDYVIRDTGGLWLGSPIIGATRGASNEIRVPVALVTGNIIVRTGTGSDVVTVRDLGTTLSGGLEVDLEDGSGRYLDTDTINYDSSTALAAGANAQLRAETINGLSGSGLTTSGSGTIHLDAGRNIFLDDNARLASGNGAITLEANVDGAVSGRYQGIVLEGAEVESQSGSVRLEGRGGTEQDRNYGVVLSKGSLLEAGGALEVIGTGGGDGSAAAQLGLLITSSEVRATGSGGLSLQGSGGTGTQYAPGVTIEKNSVIDGGSGAVLIEGTGGTGGSNNYGVSVAGSRVETAGGDIEVSGTGRGINAGAGLRISATTVATTGSGEITFRGTGSGTGNSNAGVVFQGSSRVTGENGEVFIIGSSTGSGSGNTGVNILGNSVVDTAAGLGGITVRGTGGFGTGGGGVIVNSGRLTVSDGRHDIEGTGRGAAYGRGVALSKVSLQSLGAGAIEIDGRGSVAGSARVNGGIFGNGTTISASGSGTIALRGTGGAGSLLNHGVQLANTQVSSAVGISISGAAGGNGGNSSGVSLERGTVVAGSGNAAVTINGTGSSTGTNAARSHRGVMTSAATVSTVDGDLTLSGTGGGDAKGTLNHGVDLLKSNLVATGSGRILVTGSAARGGTGISGSKAFISTATGDAILTGEGGDGTRNHRGVNLVKGGLSSSAGGDISVHGTAHTGTVNTGNVGVFIETSSVGTSGTFSIFGTGGGGTGKNHGVFLNKLTHSGSAIVAVGVKTDGSSKSSKLAGDYFA